MTRVVVVGSGASGVHFALTALRRGHAVRLVDAGHTRPPPVAPDATFEELKETLADPVAYFLGPAFEGVALPSAESFYAHPPSKAYVFARPRDVGARLEGMSPLFTLAQGGFAEAWTAGAYPFAPSDLAGFPFGHDALAPHYAEAARRIGISAEPDDLDRFFPFGEPYQPPLALDPHAALLLERYRARRSRLQRDLGFHLGRSRLATLTRDQGDRKACAHTGRCFWGCPIEALYRPSVTLDECRAFAGFEYVPGHLARAVEYDEGGAVRRLLVTRIEDQSDQRVEGDVYVLAAGGLMSSKIVLESLYRRTGQVRRLTGLMDNRQVHLPFLTPGLVGREGVTAHYQFHQLAFGLTAPDPAEYVHGQITTLKAALVHPVLQSLPTDFRTALAIFRAVRAGLGLANLNLSDTPRSSCYVTLAPADGGASELVVHYEDDPAERPRIARAIRRSRRALRQLGAWVPPGMTRVLPKGFSVHYAGTLPMTAADRPLTTTREGRVRGFTNLYAVDGATFPALPAKNLTLTLMANAIRVAEAVL